MASATTKPSSAKRTVTAVKIAALCVSLVVGAQLMAAVVSAPGHAWRGWFALLPLFLVIRRWRAIPAMLAGSFWGVSLYVFCISQPEATVAPAIRSLLSLATIPAAYAAFGAWLTRRIGFKPFVLGVGWMGVELVLGPAGLHRGLLGGMTEDGGVTAWVGQALGYVLVAFVIALANASLISVLGGARVPMPCGPCLRDPEDAARYHLASQTLVLFPLGVLLALQPRAPPQSRVV